ncbi:hypothetical protein GC163_17905 [bacterium]|nr:hypothetical protein [bacterium]
MQRTWQLFEARFTSGDHHWLVWGALIVCSVFTLVQLLRMWGSRWGDQNSLTKSFVLSLLVHICVGLGWTTIIERDAWSNAAMRETPIAVQQIRVEPDSEPQQTTADAAAFLSQTPTELMLPDDARVPVDRPTMPLEQPPPLEVEPLPMPTVEAPAMSLNDVSDATPRIVTTESPRVTQPEYSDLPEEVTPATARRESTPVMRSRQSPTSRSRSESAMPQESAATPSMAGKDRGELTEVVASLTGPRTPDVSPRVPQPLANSRGNTAASQPRSTPRADPVPPARTLGVLYGVARDAETGQRLGTVTVRVELPQGAPVLARTNAEGLYELTLPQIPDNIAITAFRPGYVPQSQNLRAADVTGKPRPLNFDLRRASDRVIATESEPQIHHLGNDQFSGAANSQFQRPSEGAFQVVKFSLTKPQTEEPISRASITFLAKGMQCVPEIRLNEHVLTQGLTASPEDGSFGTMVLPIDPAWLKTVDNVISFRAVLCHGDLDDFEFVNVQVRLSP